MHVFLELAVILIYDWQRLQFLVHEELWNIPFLESRDS